ncbi:voltage-gated potassium channel subunit beta [Phytophthora nicotianae]|uniref:Voltage-gated potassium channel subunit beta n=1 Tax=Phytophthora nicotianae TaxID=4792 RepID=A0A0W8C586_PHYNI|nr:voltage-gated potassium channel subunit beta [Phytophthora nicotianae]
MIPRDMMMKLTVDRFGNRFKPQYAVWRKLRTYTLIPGTCSAPTRASVVNVAISHAIRDAFGATADELRRTREGIVEETLDAVDGAEVDDLVSDHHSTLPSTPSDPEAAPDDIGSYVDAKEVSMESEGFAEMHEAPPIEADDNSVTVCENEMHSSAPVMNNEGYTVGTSVPTTSGEATTSEETASTPIVDRITAPTDQELQDANNYLRSIPTQLERAKKRHQPKKRGCPWHKPRSRKRRYQTKCAVTRSGTQIYHAHSIKAKKVKQLLKIAGVKSRLKALRLRRPNFKEPVKGGRVLLDEVPWPEGVRKISSCERNGIIFPDLGSYCKCRCIGDYFWDSCDNAEAAVYCTPSCCNLGARCSNAPIERSTLKLFDTGRLVSTRPRTWTLASLWESTRES